MIETMDKEGKWREGERVARLKIWQKRRETREKEGKGRDAERVAKEDTDCSRGETQGEKEGIRVGGCQNSEMAGKARRKGERWERDGGREAKEGETAVGIVEVLTQRAVSKQALVGGISWCWSGGGIGTVFILLICSSGE